MNQEDKNSIIFVTLIFALMCAFFYFILGRSGALSFFGIVLMFVFPTYIIINNFEMDPEEKIMFSFFIGIGIFTPVAYWIGMFISFRISLFVSMAILIGLGIFLKKFRKTS